MYTLSTRLAAFRLLDGNDGGGNGSGSGSGSGGGADEGGGNDGNQGNGSGQNNGQPQAGSGSGNGQQRDWEKEAKENAKEAQGLRSRLKQLEDAEAERQKASMSDLEKAQAERDEAKQKIVEAEKKAQDAEIRATAAGLGFINPVDALALLDRGALKDDLSNVKDLLEKLKTDRPYLARTAGSGGGTNNPAGGGSNALEQAQRERVASIFPSLKNRLLADKK